MYKKLKTILLCVLAAFFLHLPACTNESEQQSSDSSSSTQLVPILNEMDLKLFVGETFTLQVLNYDGPVEWDVSDYQLFSVENGVVKCLGVGNATITAKVDDNTLTCIVVGAIDYVATPRVILSGEVDDENGYSLNLLLGSEYELTPLLKVADKTIENVNFVTTSGDNAVSVVGNVLKGIAVTEGTVVTISVEYNGKTYSVTCLVKVGEIAV